MKTPQIELKLYIFGKYIKSEYINRKIHKDKHGNEYVIWDCDRLTVQYNNGIPYVEHNLGF